MQGKMSSAVDADSYQWPSAYTNADLLLRAGSRHERTFAALAIHLFASRVVDSDYGRASLLYHPGQPSYHALAESARARYCS